MKRLLFLIFSLIFAASCSQSSEQTGTNTASTQVGPQQTKGTSSTKNANYPLPSTSNPPIVPDSQKTPGDTLDVTKADICTPGYSKKVRNVPQAVKEQAYKLYNITSREPGEYEVDHLISLELGGSNSIKNLWPESFRTEPWNARVKDKLENKLHEMICSDKIDIHPAQ
jgi:hypothetical protein